MPLVKQLSVEHSGHLCLIQPENQLLDEYNIEMNGIFIANGKYSLHLTLVEMGSHFVIPYSFTANFWRYMLQDFEGFLEYVIYRQKSRYNDGI